MPTPLPEPPRAVIPLQSRPSGLIVIPVPPDRPTMTVISRHWAAGSCAGRRLCPPGACGVTRTGMCTVVAPGVVDEESARSYRIP